MAKFGESSDLVRCSFCGKTQKEVAKLIAGPGCYICNECIALCNDILEEELGDTPAGGEVGGTGPLGDDDRRRLREARGALYARLGRAPTVSELAAELGWTDARVTRAARHTWFATAPAPRGDDDVTARLTSLQRQVDELRRQLAEHVAGPLGVLGGAVPDSLIAAGIFEGGLRWRLHAAGSDQDYSTDFHLVGYHHGGMGGPKLPVGALINAYTGRDDSGPLAIAVRADPSVSGVDVVMLDGTTAPLVCAASIDGLRFYVGVAWPPTAGPDRPAGLALQELRAVDHAARIVASEDLRRWNSTG